VTTFVPSASEEGLVYTYRPSLMGAPWQFKLDELGIAWSVGGHSGRVAFRDVRRVRMSYKPVSMQPTRFLTELWADGAPKLEIVSSTWKSMIQQERLDDAYSAFIRELHRRLARTAAPVRYECGTAPFKYWVGFAMFVVLMVGFAILAIPALQSGFQAGALTAVMFFILFGWQVGRFFLRNRPGVYRADAPPEALLPKG